jgi:hypothetical protein
MTPLLLAGLIAMWGIVLGFTWLNRKDAGDEARSVDRFDAAMRCLSRPTSRRGSRPDQRYVVMPRRNVRGATVDNDPRNRVPGSRARLIARRRRTMTFLAGATLFVLFLSLVGALPLWLAWVFGLLLGAYVFHLRVQAKRSAELRARRRSVPAPRGVAVPSAPAPRPAPAVVAPPVAEIMEVGPSSAHDDAWQPTPVPLPTYVSKPVVPTPSGTVRRLDLSTLPHKAPLQAPVEPLLDDRSALIDDTAELEAIIERRRAVGH